MKTKRNVVITIKYKCYNYKKHTKKKQLRGYINGSTIIKLSINRCEN